MTIRFPVRSSDIFEPIGGKDTVVYTKAVDGGAGTATAELPIFRAPFACTITAINITPGAALTADDTNNAVLLVDKRPATDPGTPANIATLTTNVAAGDWVAWTPVSLGALTGATLQAGDVVTFEITKGGTGVAVPRAVLSVDFVRNS